MKKIIIIVLVLFAIMSTRATAQSYTFKCVSEPAMTGDSCEGCIPWQIQSRSFDGLVIWESGNFYRWIEIPYTLKVRGDTVDIWEHTSPPSRLGKNQFFPDRISIRLSQTPFSTIQGFVDSVWCNRPANGSDTTAIWYASDSTTVGNVFRGDTVTIVGRGIIGVAFDSILNKYIITADTTGLGGGGGAGTVTSVAATAPAAGFTISGSPITTAGTFLFALADDLAALEALSGTGIMARTAANTYALRTITAGTGNITVTNGGGVSGNPVINNTDPDQSTTNEIQAYVNTGTTSYTNTLSLGGGSFKLDSGSGIGVSHTAGTVTISNTGDLSATNEFQVLSNSSDATHHYIVLSDGGGSVTLTEGSGITLTTSGTGSDGIVTIASSGGSGTVTSVGLSLPSIFSVSGSPVTTSGTLTGTLTTQNPNQVFAGPAAGGAATPTFRALATADLANQIVTYAKIQNVSAASRLIGRGSAGGAGVPQEITIGAGLQMTGTVLSSTVTAGVQQSGTLVNNRIAISAGSNLVKDFSNFTVDGANGRMTITNTVAGFGITQAILNIAVPTGGTNEAIHAEGNVSGNLIMTLVNANNTTTAANTIYQIATGGPSAGDPVLQFTISGGTGTVAMGQDNSDADKFKITPGTTTPGGIVDKGLVITHGTESLVGINKDAPAYALDVTGRTRSSLGFMGKFAQWGAGNIVFGAGAGTGAVLNAHSGTDNALYVSFTTGTAPTNNGVIFTGTYPNSWANTPFVTFSADATNNSATDISKFRTGGRVSTKFDFVANGTLPASTNYQFCFTIFGM